MNEAALALFENAEPRQHTDYATPSTWDRESAIAAKETAIVRALQAAADDVLVMTGKDLRQAKQRHMALERSKLAVETERAEYERDRAAANQARIDARNALVDKKAAELEDAVGALGQCGTELLFLFGEVTRLGNELFSYCPDADARDLCETISHQGIKTALGIWLRQKVGSTVILPEFTLDGVGDIGLGAFIGKAQYLKS